MPQPVLIVLHQENSTAGRVGQALRERGYALDIRKPRYGDPLPETMDAHAAAIIFGGPMSVNDSDTFIRQEIDWIAVPLAAGVPDLALASAAQDTYSLLQRATTEGGPVSMEDAKGLLAEAPEGEKNIRRNIRDFRRDFADLLSESGIGTLVVFICNHCPYGRAIADRFVTEARALQSLGIGVIAIMPNDVKNYPEDSFDNMKTFAKRHDFTFPYVIDETQEIARAYDAVCTPDFFGFNAKDELQYRGRLDESKTTLVKNARRDLYEAMKQVAETGHGPKDQIGSMGCSIKWRA